MVWKQNHLNKSMLFWFTISEATDVELPINFYCYSLRSLSWQDMDPVTSKQHELTSIKYCVRRNPSVIDQHSPGPQSGSVNKQPPDTMQKHHSGDNESIGSSVPVVSRWLWHANSTFLEVARLMVTGWTMAFLLFFFFFFFAQWDLLAQVRSSFERSSWPGIQYYMEQIQ